MQKGYRKQFCKRGHDTFIYGRTIGHSCRRCVVFIAAEWAKSHKERRRYSTKARWDKRRMSIAELKASPCMDCGNCFPPECMDFDRRENETKLFDISKAVCSENILLQEINKCDLVCANCHRIRTKSRIQKN